MSSQWRIPEGLTEAGQHSARIIQEFLDGEGLGNCGSDRFYSPDEWAGRGEQYGDKALLVITHGDPAAATVFNWDYSADGYRLRDELDKRLRAAGTYVECCTNFYSGVYEAPTDLKTPW
ncbi:hypothetical protein [Gordonia sihwensis]|uniref:hypothetical protein n=1 Tax=Gordonia sihwensis TaxID=173559 RepID=UPI003D9711A3